MSATLATLAVHARPPHVAIEESPLGGPVARLTHGRFQVLVALHGAQVLNWTEDGDGLLWLSPVARIRTGKGIRGGIPVCWPWFADHPTDVTKAAHGFVRHRPWAIATTAVTADAVSITLATATTDSDLTLWPHRAEARLTVTLGDGMSLSLETRNTGDAPFALTEALHTYFRVSDISAASVTGLEGRAYLDKLEGFARKTQNGAIAVPAEVDRIYLGDTSHITLADAGSRRRIGIASAGSRSAVVWNPWTAKTARLGDMGSPEAFRQMLCIETANAGDDIVTLAPGGTHVLGVTYIVEPSTG
ncbi:MAG: D-hexose-6-phosphate mutarotase [Hyphomicrobiaceae bacterium]